VYVPRVRSGFVVPRWLFTALAALCAVVTALAFAALFTRSTSDDTPLAAEAVSVPKTPGSVAYVVPEGRFDVIYVRDVTGAGAPRRIASFVVPYFDNHLRGATSPPGDRIAVLHLVNGAEARLSLVRVSESLPFASSGGETLKRIEPVEGTYNYLSDVAWSADGARLALTRKLTTGDPPAAGFELVEVNAHTLVPQTLHQFPGAFDVSPVGYAPDGRLLVVVVDKAGSSLWASGDGELESITTFSPGLTRDWRLSPTGDRLAFVEYLGAGERSSAGRMLMIATGRVSEVLTDGNQLGVAWKPDAPSPDFGGEAGTVALESAAHDGYIVPLSWTPDGGYLVATVVTTSASGSPVETVEIMSGALRVPLAEGASARFLGLVPGE
jgi:hypothetical protein